MTIRRTAVLRLHPLFALFLGVQALGLRPMLAPPPLLSVMDSDRSKCSLEDNQVGLFSQKSSRCLALNTFLHFSLRHLLMKNMEIFVKVDFIILKIKLVIKGLNRDVIS